MGEKYNSIYFSLYDAFSSNLLKQENYSFEVFIINTKLKNIIYKSLIQIVNNAMFANNYNNYNIDRIVLNKNEDIITVKDESWKLIGINKILIIIKNEKNKFNFEVRKDYNFVNILS